MEIPDYKLIRCVGSGGFGEVWLAHNVFKSYRAVKIIRRQSFKTDRAFEQEFIGLENYMKIEPPPAGCVRIDHVGRNDREGYCYYVMELADDASKSKEFDPDRYEPKTVSALVSHDGSLTYETCLEIGLHASEALMGLHDSGLLHRDLKPSNLIYVHGSVKLADVGCVMREGDSPSAGGTPGYDAQDREYRMYSDVFSLGRVLYRLLTGLPPENYPDLPAHWNHSPDFERYAELMAIVRKACSQIGKDRYASAREMHHALNLLKVDWSTGRVSKLRRTVTYLKRALVLVGIVALLGGYEYWRIRSVQYREARHVADTEAWQAVEKGDLLGAVPWYSRAMELSTGGEADGEVSRRGMQVALRYAPRKVGIYFETGEVHRVAFSPDGYQLAEALASGQVKIRSLGETNKVMEFSAHTSDATSICWSPNSQWVLTAGHDQKVVIWDAVSAHRIAMASTTGLVVRAVFDNQATRVAALLRDPDDDEFTWLQIFEVVMGDGNARELRSVYTNKISAKLRCVRFDSRSESLWLGGEDGKVRKMKMNGDAPIPAEELVHPDTEGSPTWVFDVAVNGEEFASAPFDGMVRVGGVSMVIPRKLLVHAAPVRSVEFSPDHRWLLTACDDSTARIWDLNRGAEAFPALRHHSFVTQATFSPHGRLIATVSTEGVVTIWDLAPLAPRMFGPRIYSDDGVRYAQLFPHTLQVAGSALNQDLLNYSTPEGGAIRDARFSPTSGFLAICREASKSQSRIEMWKPDGHVETNTLTIDGFCPGQGDQKILHVSEDGRQVILQQERQLECWDRVKSLRQFTVDLSNTNGSVLVAVSEAAGAMLVAEGRESSLLWLTNGFVFKRWTHEADVGVVRFSRDGRFFALGCRDNGERPLPAFVGMVRSGTLLTNQFIHADGIADLRFTDDSRVFATADEKGIICMWSTRDWSPLLRLNMAKSLASISLDRSGRRVLAAGTDNRLYGWSLDYSKGSSSVLFPPLKHPFNLWHAQFLGEGDQVLGRILKPGEWTRAHGYPSGPHKRTSYDMAQDWEYFVWDIGLEKIRDTDLLALGEVVAARKVDMGRIVELSTEELKVKWQKVRANPRFSAYLKMDPGPRPDWHHEQARVAAGRKDWGALQLHSRFEPK